MKIVNHILVLVVVVATICNANGAPAPVCWKDSYGRGVGKLVHVIHQRLSESGALCYPYCRNDTQPTYYGVGPVCWQHCKPGYVDEGALCRKDKSIITYAKHSYGRGAGYPFAVQSLKLRYVILIVRKAIMVLAQFVGLVVKIQIH